MVSILTCGVPALRNDEQCEHGPTGPDQDHTGSWLPWLTISKALVKRDWD